MSIPEDRSYTEEHEWVMIAPGEALPTEPVRVGITSIATDQLGDLVYLDLPSVGDTVTVGQACGEVESTKTVSELYPPVTGQIVEVNQAAIDDPAVISDDPYGDGWLFTVTPEAAGALLTAAEYEEKIGSGQ